MSQITPSRKQKIVSEAMEYWVLFVYLACFFGAFTWYRRLILATYDIGYAHYGVAVLKALILAKVVLIGEVLHLGQRFEDRRLIVPTLYKTLVFSLWVGAFEILEPTIRGLLHGEGLTAGLAELIGKGRYELLAVCLVAFIAFIPFFAFKELERVLGKGPLRTQFFRGRSAS